MTAIKKTTTKAAKTPAPAHAPVSTTKTAAAAAKAAPVSTSRTAAAKTTTAKKKTAAAPAARATTQPPVAVVPPPAPAASTPIIKAIAAKPAATSITARIDIGFGNTLFVRGEGAGLSWDKGVAMNCLAADHWELTLPEVSRPVVFKFLVNDLSWSAGADYTVAPGAKVTLTPEF